MAERNLHVIHLLIPRLEDGTVKFLLYPHPKWHSDADHEPLLSFPTKKTVREASATVLDGHSLELYLDEVMQEDLQIPDASYALEVELPPATAELESPGQHVPTCYAIYPLVLWVDPAELDPLQARARGEWLSCQEGIEHPHVSETARRVFRLLVDREAEIDRLERETPRAEAAAPGQVHLAEPPRRLLRDVPRRPSMDALARKWRARNRSGVSILDGATLDAILDAGGRAFNLRVADPYLRHQRQGLGLTWSFFSHKDPQDLHVHGAPIVEIYGVLEGQMEIWWKGYDERGSAAWSHRVLGPGDWAEVDALNCHVVHWLDAHARNKGVVFKAGPGPLSEVGRLGVKGKTPCDGCSCIRPPRLCEMLKALEEKKHQKK